MALGGTVTSRLQSIRRRLQYIGWPEGGEPEPAAPARRYRLHLFFALVGAFLRKVRLTAMARLGQFVAAAPRAKLATARAYGPVLRAPQCCPAQRRFSGNR